jgi:hypothetical protein
VRDGVVIAVLAGLVYLAAMQFDVVSQLSKWFLAHNYMQIDELAFVALFLVAASAVFIWRRRSELLEQVRERERAENEKAALIPALEKALQEVQSLSSLLPVCAWCKRIRDDDGTWNQVDAYLHKHTSIGVTHGICPDCAERIKAGVRP